MEGGRGGGVLTGLLERDNEVASLGDLVRDAAAGHARLALVEGPAGIGKTRLLSEARREAAGAGLRVLSARGGELEREFPFGIVRQLFEPALVDPAARERAFAGAAAGALPVFETVNGGDASFAVLHGLYWLTANMTNEQPLLLAIDDLNWSDQPSLRFLTYLVRRLEGLPALVITSLRPAERAADTAALVAEIGADPIAITLAPRPLTAGAVAELVRARLGADADGAFSAACHSATGGNPLLLNELLKALDAEQVPPTADQVPVVAQLGPRAASRAVIVRLARLPPDAIAAARALAVLGDGAELATVADLAGLDADAAGAAARELVRAEIIRPETPLGFVHALVGAAVYQDVPVGERELAHARAARVLADVRAPAEQVAAHLLVISGRREPWIADTLMSAARTALQKGAADSAVAYLTRALAEPPPSSIRPQLLFELGAAEALTNAPAATEHLREAYELIEGPPLRTAVANVLARALMFTGRPEEAEDVAARALDDLPPELAELRDGLDAFARATIFFGSRPWSELPALADMRALPAHPTPAQRGIAAVGVMSAAYTGAASADECAALAARALEGGHLLAYDNGMLSMAAIVTLSAADRDEAAAELDASLADAYARGSLFSVSSVHLWRGYSYIRRGELPEAEADLRAATEEFEVYGYSPVAGAYLSAFLGRALVERGDVAGARAAVDAGRGARDGTDGHRFWLDTQVEVLAAESRWDDVVDAAEEVARLYPEVVNPALGNWRGLRALALDRSGRRDEALAAAREELELAERWGAPGALARCLRTVGLVQRDDGIDRLRDAVDAAAGSPARLEHAKSLAALGAALRRSRRPTDARDPLRQALELAEAAGAGALADSVRTELYASGARPRRSAGSLTASERRVAALAAEGQTNRDIAQALFVTPKTVEVHLSNAYRKLGIRSRRELSVALVAV